MISESPTRAGGAASSSRAHLFRVSIGISVDRNRPINKKHVNFSFGPFPNILGRKITIVFAP